MLAAVRRSGVLSDRNARHDLLFRSEVEHELSGYWFKQFPFMTESNPVPPCCNRTGLKQRILEARSLLARRHVILPRFEQRLPSKTCDKTFRDLRQIG